MNNVRENIARGFFERERGILKFDIDWDELFIQNKQMYLERADCAIASIGVSIEDLGKLRAGTHRVVPNEG